MHGSGAVSCSCSLLIRGPILPAVRQKLHLSPCADSRSRLYQTDNGERLEVTRSAGEPQLIKRIHTMRKFVFVLALVLAACQVPLRSAELPTLSIEALDAHALGEQGRAPWVR